MEKLFIPYEQALALNVFGFDEPCLGYYFHNNINIVEYNPDGIPFNHNSRNSRISAPLFQQAFKWFREEHGLYLSVTPEFYIDGINFNWQVLWYLPEEEWTEHNVEDGTFSYGDNGEYPTQRACDLGCLTKLIELVQDKINHTV